MIETPIRIVASANPNRAADAIKRGDLGVALYNIGRPELAGLGSNLTSATTRLPRPPSIRSWDFLSIALAIFAADRLVMRASFPDSWTRMIAIEVELAEPEIWQAHAAMLENMLRFLSGDIWYLSFRSGGAVPPAFQSKLSDRECACLFSGGLDSLIGAIDLKQQGRRPLLVSQASPKEGRPQAYLADKIGLADFRFDGKASERWRPPYEPSSRARSILFLAYGAVVASTIKTGQKATDLFVPENGLISINAPLTKRHIGSLSTRTTHPHFVSSLQALLDVAEVGVNLINPYGFKTKGEMLAQCQDRIVEKLAPFSYSCGKGKRLNQHCGRCVPCLIRRASFHAAAVVDSTPYWADDLSEHSRNEDILAVRTATSNLSGRDVGRWVSESGPLPYDQQARAKYIDVVRRGMEELRDYLQTIAWQ